MLPHASSVRGGGDRRVIIFPLCVGLAVRQGPSHCMQPRTAARAAAQPLIKQPGTPRRFAVLLGWTSVTCPSGRPAAPWRRR